MVLTPLSGFVRLSTEFDNAVKSLPQLASNAQWQNYKLVSWLIFSATAAISFVAGYRLWKIHFPESVRFAILTLWLAGPLGNVFYIISSIVIFGGNAGGNARAQMVKGTIQIAIVAGIWTAYLMRSERVKNTYNL
jgi:hypothetical protein